MATPDQIADYYAGYPDPDNSRTWGALPSGVRIHSFTTAQHAWEAEHGAAPKPATVAAPPIPGAGMAAARAGDTTAHGGAIGPVTTGQSARVLIGFAFAACQGDPHVCPMFSGPKPHGGGTITLGSKSVLIGGKPAARVSDLTVCTSEPGQVAVGEASVLIGDLPGGAGTLAAGNGADADAGTPSAEAEPPATDRVETSTRHDDKVKPPSRPPGESVREAGVGTHWISIELVDEAEQPVVGERYRITLPDSREIGGALDDRGRARINGLQDPGWCRISFPRLDMDAWHRAGGPGRALPAPDTATRPAVDAAGGPIQPGQHAGTGRWHTAERGACVSSIAFGAGLFWQTIWDHPANAALRHDRGNPNVLHEGDATFVPDIRQKADSGSTDQHHRFVRRGEPAQLQLRVLEDDEPRSGAPWVLEVDGRSFQGQTDADGNLSIPMMANARRAVLRVGPPGEEDEYELDLGTVEPVTSDAGLRARLENLEYLDYEEAKSAEVLAEALREFQCKHGLAITGEPDEATRSRLLEQHGS